MERWIWMTVEVTMSFVHAVSEQESFVRLLLIIMKLKTRIADILRFLTKFSSAQQANAKDKKKYAMIQRWWHAASWYGIPYRERYYRRTICIPYRERY
jgi:hypothetical protein